MGTANSPGATSSSESHPAPGPSGQPGAPLQSPEELKEEARNVCRLQIMMNLVMQVISQDLTITVDQAAEMVADTRRAALALFPDKELAFNLIYWPRLQRVMRERFWMQ